MKTWSVDAGGRDAAGVRRSLGGNPETGPFYVEGALPGDTLVVRFTRIRLNRDTAMSGGSIAASALNPYYLANLKKVGSRSLRREGSMRRRRKCTAVQKDISPAQYL